MTTKEISAAEIARSLGVTPREARMRLRAAGIKAPYAAKDVAKMKAIIKGDSKPKATDKGKAKRRSETRTDYPSA